VVAKNKETSSGHSSAVTVVRVHLIRRGCFKLKQKKSTRKGKNQKKRLRGIRQQQAKEASPAPAGVPPSPLKPFVTLTEAQENEENFKIFRQQQLDWLRGQAAELEEILLQYNSFDLIANLTITQLALNPETYKESTHHGLAFVVEYATLLYLKHPFNEGRTFAIGQVPLEEIDNRIRSVHLATSLYYGFDKLPATVEGAPDARDSLGFRTMSSEMTVRSPGYEHHHREQLQVLFDPVKDWMLGKIGFSSEDVNKVEDASGRVTHSKLLARVKEGKKNQASILRDLQRARRKQGSPEQDYVIGELRKLSPKHAKEQLKNLLIGWVCSFAGTAYSFTVDELAGETSLQPERVRAVLKFFSLEFGSMPSDFYLFSPTHPLRDRPLIRHNEVYLYPVPGSIVWALQPRLEALLNPSVHESMGDAKTWEKFQQHRANYLEEESLRLLGETLQTTEVYPNLRYSIVEDGENKKPELDGLIAFDRTLFLVEAKAGAFAIAARRGVRERIKSTVTDLLSKAHNQALRARDYIESTNHPAFFRQDGSKIPFDKERFHRIILVTVTLEPMDVFNASLHEVAMAGLIKETELPWAVSLDTLRVIGETNEFPSQLVHYLTRRLRINEFKKFYAHDELDWFGHYLAKGLYFENDDQMSDATHVVFDSSFAGVFDDYYFYSQGQRKKFAPKPTQPMPNLMRRIIIELESHKEANGRSEAIIQLLDWDDESRKQFAKGFEQIRKRVRTDREIHDFTMASTESKTGITCFAALSPDAEKALKKLQSHIVLKKYQIRADKWLGLFTVVDQPGLIHGFISALEPWIQDEQLAQLAATLPSKVERP
jgi:hypothetical protein